MKTYKKIISIIALSTSVLAVNAEIVKPKLDIELVKNLSTQSTFKPKNSQNLELLNVRKTFINNGRAALEFGLFGNRSHEVEIWIIPKNVGNQTLRAGDPPLGSTKIWSRERRFSRSGGGNSSSATIDLAGHDNLINKKLLIRIPECSQSSKCRTKIDIGNGSNIIPRMGPTLPFPNVIKQTFDFENQGLATSDVCKARFSISGRAKEVISVQKVNPNNKYSYEFRYPKADSGKKFIINLYCKNGWRESNRNTLTGTLR